MCRAIHGICHQPPLGKSSPLGTSEQCRHFGAKPYKIIACEHAGTDKCPGMVKEGNETDYTEYLPDFVCTNPTCPAYPRPSAPMEEVRQHLIRLMAEVETKSAEAGGFNSKTEGPGNPHGTGMEAPEFKQVLLDYGFDPWVPDWDGLDMQTAVPLEIQLAGELIHKSTLVYFIYRTAKKEGKPIPAPTEETRAPKSTEFNLQARYVLGGTQPNTTTTTSSGPSNNKVALLTKLDDNGGAKDSNNPEADGEAGNAADGEKGGGENMEEVDVSNDKTRKNKKNDEGGKGVTNDMNDGMSYEALKTNPFPRPDPDNPARRAPGERQHSKAETTVLLWACFETRPDYDFLQRCLPDRTRGTISTTICRLKQEIVRSVEQRKMGFYSSDEDEDASE